MDSGVNGQQSGSNPSLGGVVPSDPPHLPSGVYIVIHSFNSYLPGICHVQAP